MLHDPDIYPNPLDFVPERWLAEPSPPHPREIIFGFGRRYVVFSSVFTTIRELSALLNRICPGMIMADSSFYISTVMILALFDIKATKESPTNFSHAADGVLDGAPIWYVSFVGQLGTSQ